MNPTVKGVLFAALILVVLDGLAASEFRQRWLLMVAGLAFAVLLVRQRAWLLSKESRVPVLLALLASFVPVFSHALFDQQGDRILAVTAELMPTIIGWCVLLALTVFTTHDATATNSIEWKPTPLQGFLALGAVFILLAVVHYVAVGDVAFVSDEVLYLTQSRWIRPGQWTASMDPAVAPFFLMRQIDYLNGHLVGQYPAGWPMLLAAFRMAGLEWWSSIILGTVSVALLYLLGVKLFSRSVGVIAALLMATSQQFLWIHAGYMAHAPVIACLLGTTLCLLKGLDRQGWTRMLYWAAAGVLIGIAVAARPVTGLTAGTSIVLWMLARAWNFDRRAVAPMIGAIAFGGLFPAALFIAHNVAVMGGPMVIGYEAIHGDLYNLGFGTRGFTGLDQNLNRVPLTFNFTPAGSFQATIRNFVGVTTRYLPIGLLLPVLVAALVAGYRIRWGLVVVFMLLPVAHFFYAFPQLRLNIDLLPFLLLAVATMVMAVRKRWPGLATGLVVMVLLSQIVVAIPTPPDRPVAFRPWQRSDYWTNSTARRMAFASIDSLRRAHGRILLFSREATRYDNQINRLYVLNGGDFNGPVLVARDRGEHNVELIRRHPDRVPFLIIDNHRATPATISRIDER